MKYDWPSRNAATLAVVSLTAYYSWRGISGRLVIFAFLVNILAIVIVSLVGGKNLRHRLALFVSMLCVLAGVTVSGEWKCNPRSVCTALSGIVLVVNIGSLCFLLWQVRKVSTEV
ncbi:MAG: hypothetical protein ABSC48_02970 [Terracidiphilus sp.]|jgi:ABC-type Fe3+-siderophore transport system permease subunit